MNQDPIGKEIVARIKAISHEDIASVEAELSAEQSGVSPRKRRARAAYYRLMQELEQKKPEDITSDETALVARFAGLITPGAGSGPSD